MNCSITGQGLPHILSAYASLVRIQNFLSLEEKRDISLEEDTQVADLLYAGDEGNNSTLKLENASFSWLPDSDVVLKDVNLTLNIGALYMLVGPVASVSPTWALGMQCWRHVLMPGRKSG